MQFVVITTPNIPRIEKALATRDGVELRIDLFPSIDMKEISEIRNICKSGKVIFTLRGKKNGGGFLESVEKQEALILKLCELKPDYFDIEWTMREAFFEKLRQMHPELKIISSHHDFTYSPRDFDRILNKMLPLNSYAYKVCTSAYSEQDSFRMLSFIRKHTKLGRKIIGICMGEEGKLTREEGIEAGNYLNYTILNIQDGAAPGLDFA